MPRTAVKGDTLNEFDVKQTERFTHVRLMMYPDGGIARLRVHGEPVPDPRFLAALRSGPGRAGQRRLDHRLQQHVLLLAGQPDRARPGPRRWARAGRPPAAATTATTGSRSGSAGPGVVRHAEIDTSYFIGNAPGWAALSGYERRAARQAAPIELMPKTRLQPDTVHVLRLDSARRRSRTSASTSIPTAGWPGCGCAARLRRQGPASSSPCAGSTCCRRRGSGGAARRPAGPRSTRRRGSANRRPAAGRLDRFRARCEPSWAPTR